MQIELKDISVLHLFDMDTGERIAYWDNVKFLLIVCVVVGHFVNYGTSETYLGIYMFVYSFHMPLFMFVSGLFHKNKNILGKFLAYVSIYLLFELSIFVIKRAFGKKVQFNPLRESAAPWFMLVLAYFVVIGYMLRKCNKIAVICVSIILSLITGYFTQVNDLLCISRTLYFFPFYYLGMSVNKEKIEALATVKKYKIISVAGILIWLVVCIAFVSSIQDLRPFVTGKGSYPDERYALGFLWRMLTYGLGAIVSFIFLLAVPTFRIRMLTKMGRRTLQIYFWHRNVLYILYYAGVCDFFFANNMLKVAYILLAVVVVFITSMKLFNFPTGIIMKYVKNNKVFNKKIEE